MNRPVVFNPLYLILGLVFVSASADSQPREAKPLSQYSKRIKDISQGMAEYIASSREVSVGSIRLIRLEMINNGMCHILAYTPKGSRGCIIASISTDGKSF